jgi:hypothetical protein
MEHPPMSVRPAALFTPRIERRSKRPVDTPNLESHPQLICQPAAAQNNRVFCRHAAKETRLFPFLSSLLQFQYLHYHAGSIEIPPMGTVSCRPPIASATTGKTFERYTIPPTIDKITMPC